MFCGQARFSDWKCGIFAFLIGGSSAMDSKSEASLHSNVFFRFRRVLVGEVFFFSFSSSRLFFVGFP